MNDHVGRSELPRLLSVQELANLLQIPPKTVYSWRYEGKGPPAVPIGKYLRFRVEDVLAWLDDRAETSSPQPSAAHRRRGSRVPGRIVRRPHREG